MIENDRQLANTQQKLRLLEEQVARAYERPETESRNVSIKSLERLGRQLREEIVRYRSGVKLRNAGSKRLHAEAQGSQR